MVLQKILGWILTLLGLFFIVALPGVGGQQRGYMPLEFQRVIVLVGFVMLGIGLWLLIKS